KTELSVEDIELQAFAGTMKQKFQPVAADKGLSLEVKLAAGSPGAIRTDHQMLEQIVKNFLSNALKFTSRGGIILTIDRPGDQLIDGTDLSESGLDSAKAVSISVIDTGVGIPKDKQKMIFEAFRQADGTTSRRYGGTGLGLSIATKLAKLLGGEIRMKSEEGKGSTFTLYLPETMEGVKLETRDLGFEVSNEELEESSKLKAQSSREGQPATRTESILADRKVLVVDDDMRNLFSLKKILEYKGMEVLLGKNGKEALERLNDNPDIDLVLMDIMMPEMDGYEAMGEIRKQERFKDLPVIALTAKAMKGDRAKCVEAGATDYLAKPVDVEKLFSMLGRFID
ncbi:MAG: response regulator, partial [Desulfobacterales bacterium]|nr:response regulator [Desulfobacterales bacterium]